MKLRVVSIFTSIDGEVSGYGQGRVSTFIRLAGCNLRCSYCDTFWAQDKMAGEEMEIDKILAQVKTRKITITGGEPLLQQVGLQKLLQRLFCLSYLVTIETNGSIDISEELRWGSKWPRFVIDYKLPGSGMTSQMHPETFYHLTKKDVVKFVVACMGDYVEAKAKMIDIQDHGCNPRFAFSPVWGRMDPKALAEAMIDDKLEAIFSLQIHKVLWPDVKKGEER